MMLLAHIRQGTGAPSGTQRDRERGGAALARLLVSVPEFSDERGEVPKPASLGRLSPVGGPPSGTAPSRATSKPTYRPHG